MDSCVLQDLALLKGNVVAVLRYIFDSGCFDYPLRFLFLAVFFTISAPVKASSRSQLALQYCRLHQALLHRSFEVLFVCLLLSTIRNVANDK